MHSNKGGQQTQRWMSIRGRSPPTGVRWEKDYCKCWGKCVKEGGSNLSDKHCRCPLPSVTCMNQAAEGRGCGWYGMAIHFFQFIQMLCRWWWDAIRHASVWVILICPSLSINSIFHFSNSFYCHYLYNSIAILSFLACSTSYRMYVQLQSFRSPYD